MKEPLKVAMIITNSNREVGGAERQLMTLAPLLDIRGLDIHILTRSHPELDRFEIIDGVKIHRLFAPQPKPLASFLFILNTLIKLNQLQPDIIHAFGFFSPLTAAIIAKILWKIPVIVKVLRGGSLGNINKIKGKVFGKFRLDIFRKYVNTFLVISDEIDRELAEIGVPIENRVYLPNGVDTSKFRPPSKIEQDILRTNLAITGSPTAVFTGRLAPEKGIDQLISIWPDIRHIHPGATIIILGSGDQERELRNLAGEGVMLLGPVRDVSPYLMVADLFVLPSIAEGLSNSLLEAMATGLPVVATGVGGALDVIEDDKSGRLIQPNQSDELRDAILDLFNNPAVRARLGTTARERIEHEFALSTVVNQLQTVYEQVLVRRSVLAEST